MIYRFAQPGNHSVSVTASTLRDLKAKIESWFVGDWMTYRLDERGEGWAYWRGEPLGYIDQGEAR